MNLGVLAPEGASVFLRSFPAGIDVFTLWLVALLTLGYRAVAKISTVIAGVVVAVFWLLGLQVCFAGLGVGRFGRPVPKGELPSERVRKVVSKVSSPPSKSERSCRK